MRKLIIEGLIKQWVLSHIHIDVITKAQNITPLSTIQNIYSLVERNYEANIIPYYI